MRSQQFSFAFSTLLLVLVGACSKSGEEASEKQSQAAAAKAEAEGTAALALSTKCSELRAGALSIEFINEVHQALSAKPTAPRARHALAKATRTLESGVLFAVLTGPPPELFAPWPETVRLAHELADAEGKEILAGTLARTEIFKGTADPYGAYVALSKRNDPLDQQLAAVVGIQYAATAADDFAGKGPAWMRFLANHLCTGDACVLPEVLSSLPASLTGHLPDSAAALAQTLNHLHGLATLENIPSHLAEKLKARSKASLAKVIAPVYAHFEAPVEEQPEGGQEATQSGPPSVLAWPLVRHPTFILMIRGEGIGLAERAEIHLGVDGPAWSGGAYTPLITAKEAALKSRNRPETIAAAVAKLKELIKGPGSAHLALQVAPQASGSLLSTATEILKSAEEVLPFLRAPRVLLTDGGMPGGVPVWWTDLEERPKQFPEQAMSIRHVKDTWVLEWPTALPPPVDSEAVLPDSVAIKRLGRGKRARARITVKVAEEGAALATLKAAIQLISEHFGLSIDAVRMNVVGTSDATWIHAILAAAQRNEATSPLAWIEGALQENNEFGGMRSVAIQSYAAPPKEKVKAPSKPATLAPALGYCKKRDIERVMKSRRGAFKFCYQRSLQMNPSLEGKIVTRFRIDEVGQVSNASVVLDTMKDRNVPKCLVTNLKKLKFPHPEGGECEVRWPFNFQSR